MIEKTYFKIFVEYASWDLLSTRKRMYTKCTSVCCLSECSVQKTIRLDKPLKETREVIFLSIRYLAKQTF